jgi:hypothetical protein
LRTWLNKSQIEEWFGLWHVFAVFSFKWNDVFCPKRRHFIHCSLKKNLKRCRFEQHCGSSSFPGCAKQGKKKIFLPLFSTAFSFKNMPTEDPYLPKAFHVLEKREERCPLGGVGSVAQWPPRLPYPCAID